MGGTWSQIDDTCSGNDRKATRVEKAETFEAQDSEYVVRKHDGVMITNGEDIERVYR